MTKTACIQSLLDGAPYKAPSLTLDTLGLRFVGYNLRFDKIDDKKAINLIAHLENEFSPDPAQELRRVYNSEELTIFVDAKCWYLNCRNLENPDIPCTIVAFPRDLDNCKKLIDTSDNLLDRGPSDFLMGSVGFIRTNIAELRSGAKIIDVDCIQTCIAKKRLSGIGKAFPLNNLESEEELKAHKHDREVLAKKYLPWREEAFAILLDEARERELAISVSIDSNTFKYAHKEVLRDLPRVFLEYNPEDKSTSYRGFTTELIERGITLGFITLRIGDAEINFIPRCSIEQNIPTLGKDNVTIDAKYPRRDTFGEPLCIAIEGAQSEVMRFTEFNFHQPPPGGVNMGDLISYTIPPGEELTRSYTGESLTQIITDNSSLFSEINGGDSAWDRLIDSREFFKFDERSDKK